MFYATLAVLLGAILVALITAIWMYVARAQKTIWRKVACCFGLAIVVACLAFQAWGRAKQVQACAQNIRYLGAAIEAYHADRDTYPPTLDELMPFYFDELPVCPLAAEGDKNSYELGYEFSAENFTVSCHGDTHIGLGGASAGYPRYTATNGVEI